MSEKKHARWDNQARGERLIETVLNGGVADFFDLAFCFLRGFRVDNVLRLLESDDVEAVRFGLLALSETASRVYRDPDGIIVETIAERIEHFQDFTVTYYGLEAIDRFASPANFRAVAFLLSFIDSDESAYVMQVLGFLSCSSPDEDVIKYLYETQPDSPLLNAMNFFVDHRFDQSAIERNLDHPDVAMRRCAAEMGFAFFDQNEAIRKKLEAMNDEAIQYQVYRRLQDAKMKEHAARQRDEWDKNRLSQTDEPPHRQKTFGWKRKRNQVMEIDENQWE